MYQTVKQSGYTPIGQTESSKLNAPHHVVQVPTASITPSEGGVERRNGRFIRSVALLAAASSGLGLVAMAWPSHQASQNQLPLGSGGPDVGRCCFYSTDASDVCGTCKSFEHAGDWCNQSPDQCTDCGGSLCSLDAVGADSDKDDGNSDDDDDDDDAGDDAGDDDNDDDVDDTPEPSDDDDETAEPDDDDMAEPSDEDDTPEPSDDDDASEPNDDDDTGKPDDDDDTAEPAEPDTTEPSDDDDTAEPNNTDGSVDDTPVDAVVDH